MGWQGYDNEGCMPGDRERFSRLVERIRRRGQSSPQSYTLAQLERLAQDWASENEATNDARWIVSGLLAWLAKREQGKGSR